MSERQILLEEALKECLSLLEATAAVIFNVIPPQGVATMSKAAALLAVSQRRAAHEPSPEWQPIESAPHTDGFACIVSVPNEGPEPYVGEAHFVDVAGWYWAGNDPTDSWGPGAITPSHWVPLPKGPTATKGDG